MADRVATIKGTFLIPTVSKNRRLYTKENIAKAVERMNVRLQGTTDLPLTMFPSHGSADADNALMTIGRVTRVGQESDGSATFEADIADTSAGRDMAALVTPENPYIKGLSIRGQWMSEPKTVEADGGDAVTADDLDVFGIDWTGRPGVEGAQITAAKLAESVGVENMIFESADGEFFFDETATDPDAGGFAEAIEQLQAGLDMLVEAGDAPGNGKLPYGSVTYADPGYQKDKKKRYPIDTAAHVRAAWAYINKAKNAGAYSSAQLARIKSKIKGAAKKFKIDISEEFETLETDILSTLEAYASMCISNGEGSINTSGYTDDAGKLAPLARRIAMAAIIGLNAMDPDEDGDIDLMMPDGSTDSSSSKEAEVPDDNNMESACSACGEGMIPEGALYCPTCGSSLANAESQVATEPIETKDEEAIVADETTTAESAAATDAPVAEAAAPMVALTQEQFQALLAAVKPVEAAPVEPIVEEQPKSLTQAEIDAMLATAKEEARIEAQTEAIEAFRASGIIPRTGLSPAQGLGVGGAQVAETKIPTVKELSEMSDDDYYNNTWEALMTNPKWSRLVHSADARASF